MLCFGEPVGRVKIQTTSKNSQRSILHNKTSNKRFIIQHAKLLCSWGRTSRVFIYGGMRDSSMRSGTKLAPEIQLTDWSTAGNLSNRSSGVQIPRDICTRFGRYLYSTRCSWIIKAKSRRICALYFLFLAKNKNSNGQMRRLYAYTASRPLCNIFAVRYLCKL